MMSGKMSLIMIMTMTVTVMMMLFLQFYLQEENMKLNDPTRAMLTVTTLHWRLSLPNETGKLPDWYYIKSRTKRKFSLKTFKNFDKWFS